METPKEKLFLIPKGGNGLRLHPRAFVDENMKSYEKVTGILLSVEQFQKLESDKAELLAALESVVELQRVNYGNATSTHMDMISKAKEIESLIQKHKE